MTLILTTGRLRLRLLAGTDAEAFAAYRSDPEIARYQGWDTPYTIDQARELIAAMTDVVPGTPGEWVQLAIEVQASGRLAGDCAFQVLAGTPRQAEIGLTLARPFHGKGYGTEAIACLLDFLFGELDLHRVSANCDVENPAAVRVLERLGMRREAHFVEALWFKGGWASEYRYAILQREWQARRQTLRLHSP